MATAVVVDVVAEMVNVVVTIVEAGLAAVEVIGDVEIVVVVDKDGEELRELGRAVDVAAVALEWASVENTIGSGDRWTTTISLTHIHSPILSTSLLTSSPILSFFQTQTLYIFLNTTILNPFLPLLTL